MNVAEWLESDRKKDDERYEKKRKFDAECLEEDSRTAAKRLEEDERVKRHRKDKMRGFERPYMTLTTALSLHGLSHETHLTMEDIYAAWTWRMAGVAATFEMPFDGKERFTDARDMLLDYTVKHLAVDVSLSPMDHKQAAALLEIPEDVDADRIRIACNDMVYFARPPKNGVERYMWEKKLREAQCVMLANL